MIWIRVIYRVNRYRVTDFDFLRNEIRIVYVPIRYSLSYTYDHDE